MYLVFWIALVPLIGCRANSTYAHRIAEVGPYFASGARFRTGQALDAAVGFVAASAVQEWHGSILTSFLGLGISEVEAGGYVAPKTR